MYKRELDKLIAILRSSPVARPTAANEIKKPTPPTVPIKTCFGKKLTHWPSRNRARKNSATDTKRDVNISATRTVDGMNSSFSFKVR